MKMSKILLIVLITLFACWAFSVPFVYYVFFGPEEATFTMDGLFSFYGVALGAFVTLFAVLFSIRHTKRQLQETRVLDIKPYLSNRIEICTIEDFKKNPSSEDIILYKDTSNNSPLHFFPKMPEYIKRLTEASRSDEPSEFEMAEYDGNYYFLNIIIQNIGGGNAINMDILANGIIKGPIHIKKDSERMLKIILHSDLESNESFSLSIEYLYWDISSMANYKQSEKINFRRFSDDRIKYYQTNNDFLTRPNRLN